MIISTRLQSAIRSKFKKVIHNELHQVKIKMGVTQDIKSFDYDPSNQTKPVIQIFHDFPCSTYNMLSGNTARMFSARLDFQNVPPGILERTSYVIQYIKGGFDLLAVSGVVENLVPSATVINDTSEDFTAWVKLGAKVINLTDGNSIGYVQVITANQLVVSALTGGTLNIFTLGDLYEVYNASELEDGDEIEIDDKYWECMSIIHDSFGVQVTVLAGR